MRLTFCADVVTKRKSSAGVDGLDDVLNPLLRGSAAHDRDMLPFDDVPATPSTPKTATCELDKSLPATPRLGTALPAKRQARPLSWLSMSGFNFLNHSTSTSPDLRQYDSISTMNRSGISTPVLQSTSNPRVAALEGVEHSSSLPEIRPEMTPLTSKSSTWHIRKQGQAKTAIQARPHSKPSKSRLARLRSAIFGKSNDSSSSQSKNLAQGDNSVLTEGDGDETTVSVAEAHPNVSVGSQTKEYQITESIHTRDNTFVRTNRLSQSSLARRQMNLAKEPTSDLRDSDDEQAAAVLETSDPAHPEFKFGDLQQSFSTAVEHLNLNDSTPQQLHKHQDQRCNTENVSVLSSENQDDDEPVGIQSTIDSDKSPVIESTTSIPNMEVRRPTPPKDAKGREAFVSKSGIVTNHFNPLRANTNVMEFASPTNVMSFASPPTQRMGQVNQPSVSNTALETSTPRIQVTRDEDQATELDDVPIYSESMGNLNQYSRSVHPTARLPPVRPPRPAGLFLDVANTSQIPVQSHNRGMRPRSEYLYGSPFIQGNQARSSRVRGHGIRATQSRPNHEDTDVVDGGRPVLTSQDRNRPRTSTNPSNIRAPVQDKNLGSPYPRTNHPRSQQYHHGRPSYSTPNVGARPHTAPEELTVAGPSSIGTRNDNNDVSGVASSGRPDDDELDMYGA